MHQTPARRPHRGHCLARGRGGGAFGARRRARRPPMPKITRPVMFDTPEADAILDAPSRSSRPTIRGTRTSRGLPVHPDSAAMIAPASARTSRLEYNLDMNFVIVPADQKRVEVKILDYPDESDPGPFPLPDNAPDRELAPPPEREHEGAAAARADPRAVPARGRGRPPHHPRRSGEREVPRVLAGQAHGRGLAGLERGHLGPPYRAPIGRSAGRRRDAAGLPIFPAVVRYDECARGIVEHAMRFTVRRTRRAYVLPATHWASRSHDPNLPAHGRALPPAQGLRRRPAFRRTPGPS